MNSFGSTEEEIPRRFFQPDKTSKGSQSISMNATLHVSKFIGSTFTASPATTLKCSETNNSHCSAINSVALVFKITQHLFLLVIFHLWLFMPMPTEQTKLHVENCTLVILDIAKLISVLWLIHSKSHVHGLMDGLGAIDVT